MQLQALMNEFGGGSRPRSVNTGLTVLASGALAMLLLMLLSSPAMDGLRSLPGHVLEQPFARDVPRIRTRVAEKPPLTKMQQAVARRKAVRVAAAEVGTREWGNGSNHGRRIIMYRKAVTGPGENPKWREPWCADFVSWVWGQTGNPIGFRGKGSDYVPQVVLWAKFSGRWHSRGGDYRPRPGDLVVFSTSRDRFGHIGLVASNRKGRIGTIEGNFQDQVMRRSMTSGNPMIAGWVSPV